ncbi:hypothetical protein QJ48_18890, partial [Paenibacillus sp. A3]|uniref:WIAG-tail domain n=1 Tax=Paenibacillus sp. A3 TaxID=1337054 RepID=UPI0006E65AE8
TEQLAEEAVGEAQLRAEAVTSEKLAAGAVTEQHLSEGAVHGRHLAEGAVGAEQLAAESVGETQLQAQAVTSEKLAEGAVTPLHLAEESVRSRHLAADAVMSLHLAEGAVRSRHLAEGAVGTEQLAEESVGEAQLQAQAVTSEKLAQRSVTSDHLCVESVDGLHIKQETISGYHLVPGTISFIHLEPSLQALLTRKPAEETWDEAAPEAGDPEDTVIQSEIEIPDADEAAVIPESGEGLVTGLEPELEEVHISALDLSLDAVSLQDSKDATAGIQLQPESVGSEQLAAGAVTPEHLSFQPVQTVGVRTTVQQFGLSPFLLNLEDELTEVVLIFDRPFADNNYVLVASTDQTNTYAVIQQKEPDGAILEVVRSKFSPELQGVVNWIAIGAANE